MARCGCSGSTCSCLIVAGAGTAVSGTGTEGNPYVIDVTGSDIAGTFSVLDTASVDLTLDGSGSTADPYVLSAAATIAMTGLSDVLAGDIPATGDVPVWNGTAWHFAPPPTTPPGAVNTGPGLTGDGSAPDPLTVAASGTWGTAPLDGFGANDLLGAPTYIDSAGQVRTLPRGIDVVADGARPNQYPGRVIVESGTGEAYWSNGTTWVSFVPEAVFGHAGLTGGFAPVDQTGTGRVMPVVSQTLSGGMTFDVTTRRLVVPEDGLYELTTHAYGTGGSSGWFRQHLRTSATPAAEATFATVQLHKSTSNDLTAGASATLPLTAGTGVWLVGLSSAAGFQSWGTTGHNGAFFEVRKVG